MAKNDMNAVIYKILRYLYRCMQEGKRPDVAEYAYNSDLLDIPEPYWEQIMAELIDNGYIRGVYKVPIMGCGYGIKPTPNACITIKGLEYLENNSGMRKAQEMIGKAAETAISMLPTFLGF